MVEASFAEYLRSERQHLEKEVTSAQQRIRVITRLLGEDPDRIAFDRVEEIPYDPYVSAKHWGMTSTTTMGRCREALQYFRREATAQEIAELIRQRFGEAPAKSFVEMVRKRSGDERSGIYRVIRKPGPARYGLAAWKKAGHKSEDGGFVEPPGDDEIPPEVLEAM